MPVELDGQVYLQREESIALTMQIYGWSREKAIAMIERAIAEEPSIVKTVALQ